jgi:predicted nucleotide-binding protein
MDKWTRERIILTLKQHSLIAEEKKIDKGIQFILPEGTPINFYPSTGKVLIQGKKSDERLLAESLFISKEAVTTTHIAASPAQASDSSASDVVASLREPKVFIVYGHDKECRDALELMLLRMNIKPTILSNLAPDGKTIIEALMANSEVHFAIVLLTPDDEGYRAEHPEEKRFRARQNVVLELGMFLMKLGRERVAILHKGDLELPSDIHGLIYIPFSSRVQEAKNKLAASMQKVGIYIDIDSLTAE